MRGLKRILLFVIIPLSLASCERIFVNGDFDGMWKLQSVECGDTVYTPDNIYYSFQRHLAMLGEYSDEEFPAYYMAEFDKEGNSLTMYNFYEYPGLQGISDKEKLKRYFIFGDTVRFSIEALDDDLLVMSSGGMRYCFSTW